MTEKLHKVLADLGVGSRREMERWIKAGRITVNGQTAHIGDRVATSDKLSVDGRPLNRPQTKTSPPRRVLLYYKPEGELCTRSDPEGRRTVFDRLPPPPAGRWINIGRLDINTMGLLLLTNDGALAHAMMHPSFEVEREYAVRVLGKVDNATLTQLKQGVRLEDGMARFTRITDAGGAGANHWYRVVLKEGRKHEVRRLWQAVGATVSRLIRVRFGSVSLPSQFKTGQYKILSDAETHRLMETCKKN